jgi:integrase
MTKPVRYQEGYLQKDHGAWYVHYRERVEREGGVVELVKRAKRLGSAEEFPRESDVMPLKVEFMRMLNADVLTPDASMTLTDFAEHVYLSYIDAKRRASTRKSYREIWQNHIKSRVGSLRLREFRTVHASKMLRAIAEECDLTKTTLQHIKSVLSGIFTFARNEGAFDGPNPIQGVLIPDAREPGETHAYDLMTICRILGVLPPLPKATIATASFAGLREGELKGLRWEDYIGNELQVNRSIWKNVVNAPKTRASKKSVPVIPELAAILGEYRASMGRPATGVVFHSGSGEPMDMDKLGQRVIRPAVQAIGIAWHGWHGFRRGIASNLYALGADEKVVQRILRHAKSHVTKDRYIKAFDPAVLDAMQKMQAMLDQLKRESRARAEQMN